ncbi:MAG: hypothetical protein QM811_27180 [Pirellulales bacterium]
MRTGVGVELPADATAGDRVLSTTAERTLTAGDLFARPRATRSTTRRCAR